MGWIKKVMVLIKHKYVIGKKARRNPKIKRMQSSSRIGGRSISSSSYKKQKEKKIYNDGDTSTLENV